MEKRINWEGICFKERYQCLNEINQIIFATGGFVTNFNFFSDIALFLQISIEENSIPALYLALSEMLRLSTRLDQPFDSNSIVAYSIYLHISFTHGSGKLEQEVPMVPG